MRAALLPTPGDPFMLAYWLRNYKTWGLDYVDELVVYVNGPLTPEDVAYDRGIIEAAGGRMLYSPVTVGHDGALLGLLQATSADLVVLCEDDAYVRHPEQVGVAFDDIASGAHDLVGSPRHEDYFGRWMEWGEYKPGDLAEMRHGLWPAFLFARRADLLATDCVFGDRAWPRGGTIPGWGYVGPEVCDYVGIAAEFVHLDTFFGTTFQLRAKGLRTRLVHHVRLYDAQAVEKWLRDDDPPWFHVTGLSTLPPVLDGTDPATLPDIDDHGGLWTRRLAWWMTVTAASDRPDVGRRMDTLARFASRAGIDPFIVAQWQQRFARWTPVAVPA